MGCINNETAGMFLKGRILVDIKIMPKLIDNYVLSRKIGAGQYGEVFKGYDRATNNDIAVKSIRRENVKGTFE